MNEDKSKTLIDLLFKIGKLNEQIVNKEAFISTLDTQRTEYYKTICEVVGVNSNDCTRTKIKECALIYLGQAAFEQSKKENK